VAKNITPGLGSCYNWGQDILRSHI